VIQWGRDDRVGVVAGMGRLGVDGVRVWSVCRWGYIVGIGGLSSHSAPAVGVLVVVAGDLRGCGGGSL